MCDTAITRARAIILACAFQFLGLQFPVCYERTASGPDSDTELIIFSHTSGGIHSMKIVTPYYSKEPFELDSIQIAVTLSLLCTHPKFVGP